VPPSTMDGIDARRGWEHAAGRLPTRHTRDRLAGAGDEPIEKTAAAVLVGERPRRRHGVAVGGARDYPNSCFGILGDFVVYFRDVSRATPGADAEPRWGDYLTVRPSAADPARYSAFGYFVDKVDGAAVQQPFYLSYGRP
jgi:hypothetical protein